MSKVLKLTHIDVKLAVIRLDHGEKELAAAVTTEALASGGIFTVSRTKEEISLILETDSDEDSVEPAVLKNARKKASGGKSTVEAGWRVLKCEGPFDFSLVGILAKLTAPLAEHKIPVFAVSTYDTDYLMVKHATFEKTVNVLRYAGCEVDAPSVTKGPVERAEIERFRPFTLERYFAKYEFSAPYLLSCSDCESLSMAEIINMADEECRDLWDNLVCGYTESGGLPQLREEIARSYVSKLDAEAVWHPQAENNIVLCPQEGIFLAAQALLQKGDHVVVPDLCYQSLAENALSLGCDISYWRPSLDEETGEWTFAIDDLARLVTDRTRLVVVNFPHNPTGAMLSTSEWDRLMQICETNDAYLFSDEMYYGLEFDVSSRLTPAFIKYKKAITLGGVSKSLSLPGLRIGWLLSQDLDLLSKIQTLKDYTTICPPAPSEILALIALRNEDAIISRNMEITRAGLAAVEAFFKRFSNIFAFSAPKGGTIAFPHLRKGSKWATTLDFCQDLVKDAGIMILPSSVYNLDQDPNCCRIGFGRKNVPDVVARTEAWLSKQLSHH
mmetsp:Transcript_4219/g.9138  ORF Transcript_4219/g.9138 Transcript_4219/m.9138 type:complete len:556 (+) Transcript_4219:311-1978(+)|eukprot:CAMPEP_0171579740 /NCGR_PEP_ID=MMETSP0961-20121227/8635_1 /TAXON_ID=87120 /ORGANISM="Aurantiochytrium limacinum, Strain ATCCMYA-1381" /LENGTH=555 /DNA_ID=CAMNT_0012136309 /DNA_START=256 /DNA_END=1923 /DNA_ORIENTATION=-